MATEWLKFLAEMAEVGVSEADLKKAMNSPEVKAGVINKAEKTKQMWQQVWDEMGSHPFQKGRYRDSITVSYGESKSGEFQATVSNKTPEAVWLEYGTIHMAERAPARKTIDRMNGERSSASSKQEGGGGTGAISA